MYLWLPDSGLIESPFVQIKADGPLTRAYLNVFAAKLGMALYREHVAHALPLSGGVHINWFLNAGLAQRTAEGILRILLVAGTLRQGAFEVTSVSESVKVPGCARGSGGSQLQRLQRTRDSCAHEVIPNRCLGADLRYQLIHDRFQEPGPPRGGQPLRCAADETELIVGNVDWGHVPSSMPSRKLNGAVPEARQ